MKRQSREDFLNKIDDSPSPDITGDSLTCDYGIENLYNHRRSSSSDSQDSGIGSTGSSRQSSLSSMNLETKTNPYPLTGMFCWKHPKHESFEAQYRREIESDDLTWDQEKEETTAAAFKRWKEKRRGYLDLLIKREDIPFYCERPESSDISSLEALSMKSLVLGYKNELDDDITDTSCYHRQSAVTTQDQKTKVDLLETKSRVDKQDQGSRSVMENQIPDCEDLPPPIPQRNKIKTKRSYRLSKNVNPTNEPANLKTDYFAAGTQVKPKPTKLYGKKTALFPFLVSENQYIQNRDVRKYTTFSSDLPDADNVSSQDENKSGFKSILGFPIEARGSKHSFFFKPRHQCRSQCDKYQVKNSATEKWQDQFTFKQPDSLSPDSLLMEKAKEDEFLVLCDSNYLPRFKYHRSLLDWFVRGLPHDPDFQKCNFCDCSVIVGGNLSDEKKKELFVGADTFAFQNFQKETTLQADVLIVYFYTDGVTSMHREIEKLRCNYKFEWGTLLLVMATEDFNAKVLELMIDAYLAPLGIKIAGFVIETRSEIIRKITCILEQRLSEFLKNTKTKLLKYSSTMPNVRQSLLEVNAILRKLKQAACYPKPLEEGETVETSDEEIDETGEKGDDEEIDERLQRFRDNILYQGYDGDKLYVITNDQGVKENLDVWFLESGIENVQLVVTFEEKLSTTELSKKGEPLNGAKFVYVNNNISNFKEDKSYATIGCLMLASNNMMVAVTCHHAVDKKENFFTLINNLVVKLGKELPQINKQMARLHEDIALIVIDGETRNDIDNYCERLLIDSCGEPSPAEIASGSLKEGDIVHKWGATTGLTTGIVKEVKHQAIGRFTSESTVIYITGRDSEPFANGGDSGSLIFKHSDSLEQNLLYVHAMVQSRLKVPFANAPIICFPFKESYDSLKNNLPGIQTLQFCRF